MLPEAQKDAYRQVIALAYQANMDLGRAKARIEYIDPDNSYQALAAQAQRMLAENNQTSQARALALLAADLSRAQEEAAAAQSVTTTSEPIQTLVIQSAEAAATALFTQQVAAIQSPTPVPSTPTPGNTPTPRPTFTLKPTLTPIQENTSFALESREEICGADVQSGLLQIQVYDENDNPVPGVEILLTWQGGTEAFYTGLVPQVHTGYADFQMQNDEVYTLRVGEVSRNINDIRIPGCGGMLNLVFREITTGD